MAPSVCPGTSNTLHRLTAKRKGVSLAEPALLASDPDGTEVVPAPQHLHPGVCVAERLHAAHMVPVVMREPQPPQAERMFREHRLDRLRFGRIHDHGGTASVVHDVRVVVAEARDCVHAHHSAACTLSRASAPDPSSRLG